MKSAAKAIQAAAAGYFEELKKSVIRQLQEAVNKADEDPKGRAISILEELNFDGEDTFAEILLQQLEAIFVDGAQEAAKQIDYTTDVGTDSFKLVNQKAVEYAKDRAAEMVGMKWVNGKLEPNPDAQWQIKEATRYMLRSDVQTAMKEGWSNDKLSERLTENYAFSDARAEMISRTETARADVEGNIATYRASGVVTGKKWITGAGCCDLCDELNGEEVGLEEQFSDGSVAPPLHPACRCDIEPLQEVELEDLQE